MYKHVLVRSSVSSDAPASVATFTYQARVVSKFEFKSQLLGPCRLAVKHEPKWLCNIISSPWHSLPPPPPSPPLLIHGERYSFHQAPPSW